MILPARAALHGPDATTPAQDSIDTAAERQAVADRAGDPAHDAATTPAAAGSGAVVVASDRVVPDTYVGKLEPNYYCRGWNAKRQKYCRQRAGQKTDHVGVGRCKHHGGTKEHFTPPAAPLAEYFPPRLRAIYSRMIGAAIADAGVSEPARSALRDRILNLRCELVNAAPATGEGERPSPAGGEQ